ncbi:MAG: hypothetical protein HY791_08225 [Deltaproteobacteria bacterium]|nr:hypothetical protein [Deltaproteobacteria bacterium]
MAVGALLTVCVGCSATSFKLELEADPDDVVIWARLDGESIVESRAELARDPVFAVTQPGERLWVGRFRPGEFAFGLDGRPLTSSDLLQLTLDASSSCGRCLFDAAEAPALIYAGQSCPIPPFVEQKILVEGDGAMAEVDEPTPATLRLSPGGDCACPESPEQRWTELEPCPVRGEADIAPRDIALRADGTVFGFAGSFGLAIDAQGRTLWGEFEPAFGSLRSWVSLPDGRIVLASSVRGSGGEVDFQDVRIVAVDGETLTAGPIGGLPELTRVNVSPGQDGRFEILAATRVGTLISATGATCSVSGASAECELVPLRKDMSCPNTYAKSALESVTILENGDGVAWLEGGLLFRPRGERTWSCVPGTNQLALEVPGQGPMEVPGDVSLISLGRRILACGSTGSLGSTAVVLTATVPESLRAESGELVPFPVRLLALHAEANAICAGFAAAPDGSSIDVLFNGAPPHVARVSREGVLLSVRAQAEVFGVESALLRVFQAGPWLAAIGLTGTIFRNDGASSRLAELRSPGSTTSAAVTTPRGFRIYRERATALEIVAGSGCEDVEVLPTPIELSAVAAVTQEGDVDVVAGVEEGALVLTRVRGESVEISRLGPIPAAPVQVVSLGSGRLVMRLADGALWAAIGDRVQLVSIGPYLSLAASQGVALAGKVGGIDRVSPALDGTLRAISVSETLEGVAFAQVDAQRNGPEQVTAISLECPDRGRVEMFESLNRVDFEWTNRTHSAWVISGECGSGAQLCPDFTFRPFALTAPAPTEVATVALPGLLVYAKGTLHAAQGKLTTLPFDRAHQLVGSSGVYVGVSSGGEAAVVFAR